MSPASTSCARSGQAPIAPWIDVRNVVGVGNDCTRTLENHRALEFFCQFAGRHEPVGLHLRGCGVQQPRCLQRMGVSTVGRCLATRCQRLLQGHRRC